jgi:tRNA pseudouridine55 synthase
MADGVLVIDKPAGPTSFEVVRRVRRLLGEASAGHTGTLDPMATGVLAVCVGEALKLQHWLAEGDKAYEATVAFGAATETEDAEGKFTERGDPSGLDAARVASALPRFTGEIEQTPPMYSAVRVGGRRLHEAARRGEEVARDPRRVRVHALALLAFEPAREGLARARLHVRCGKGTYVRTLAADLGRALGVPAHLEGLRRTEAGPFGIAAALPLAEAEALLASSGPEALRARLVPPAEALAFLPAARLDEAGVRDLGHGKAVALAAPEGMVRALDAEGRLVAVCRSDGRLLRPVRVLRTGEAPAKPRPPAGRPRPPGR